MSLEQAQTSAQSRIDFKTSEIQKSINKGDISYEAGVKKLKGITEQENIGLKSKAAKAQSRVGTAFEKAASQESQAASQSLNAVV